MRKPDRLRFDEIGYWSEIKLDIVKEYAQAYSTILSAQENPRLSHCYIDAFSGPGEHISRTSGEMVPGSPLNALMIEPPFDDYYFIDLDGDKLEHLKELVGDNSKVHFDKGDSNSVLVNKVFPKVKYSDYRRGLCLLDPYGLHLNWEVIQWAGEEKTIEIFLNFPTEDINRNVFWHDPEGVDERDIERMNAFWGDESWRNSFVKRTPGLFETMEERAGHKEIAESFQEKLKNVAKFRYVPEPIPMRNSRRAVVYYLFFASQNPVAAKIVRHIFDKYRTRMP